MSRFCALLSLCALVDLTAQTTSWPYGELATDSLGPWENYIALDGHADYNANSLNNELPYALWRGAFLERELRERGSEALRERNSAGYLMCASATWTGKAGVLGLPERWRPMLRLAHQDLMGIRYTADVYRMSFFGNAAYEGKDAELGPSAYMQVRYQSIGAGIQHADNGSFVRLDMLLGQSFAAADMERADVFTGQDGRVIRADLMSEILVSDTASSAWGRNNGMGASLSGRYVLRPNPLRPTRLIFEVEDLGVIRWNDHAMQMVTDTMIEFTGWSVANILDLDEVFIGEQQLLDTLGLVFKPGAFTALTPFLIHLKLEHRTVGNWMLSLSIEQRNLPGYVPHVMALASRRVGSWAQFGADLSYGGFGQFRMGLGGRFHLGERLRLHIYTPHAPGFFMGTMRGWGVLSGLSIGF